MKTVENTHVLISSPCVCLLKKSFDLLVVVMETNKYPKLFGCQTHVFQISSPYVSSFRSD